MKARTTPSLLLCICFVVLSGCKTYKHLNEELESSEPTAGSFEQMDFRQIPLGESEVFVLGKTGEVYDFESGKAYYLAFSLPSADQTYPVEVRSHFSNPAGKLSDIAYPRLLILDEELNVARTISAPFEVDPNAFGGPPLTSFFPIEFEKEKGEAFMIIYTDPNDIGSMGNYQYHGTVAASGIVIESNRASQIEFVAGGVIKVMIGEPER